MGRTNACVLNIGGGGGCCCVPFIPLNTCSCLHAWWFSTVDCICFFNVCDRVCWILCSVVRRTSRWPCCCSSAQRATTSRTPSPSSTTSTTGSTCWTTLWVTHLSRQPRCTFSPVRKMNLHFWTCFFSDSLFRARSPTNGRSHPPGVFCLGMASLQHCSDPRTFSFLSIFSP